MKLKAFVGGLFVLAAMLPIAAQEKVQPTGADPVVLLPKKEVESGKPGTIVTLKIPMGLLQHTGIGGFEATITGTPGALKVNGIDGWETNSFPSMLRLDIREASKTTSGKPMTEVWTYTKDITRVTLNFDAAITDVEAAFRELVIPGEPTSEAATTFLTQRNADIKAKWFTGSLAQVPEDAQMRAFRYAAIEVGASTVGVATYKEQSYVLLDLGEGSSIYNTLKMDETARVARTINDKLLKVFKGSAAAFSGFGETVGVKVQVKVLSKSFAEKYLDPEADLLVIYAPFELIKKFADADITSQQLIDGSVVLVNDNRVQVPLAGAATR